MSDHVPFEDLSARLDGALPQVRCDQIDAHLAACDECRAEFESLRWTVSFTRAQPRTPMPRGASMHVPVVAAEPKPLLRLPRLELVLSAGAAIAALALVALVVGSRLPGSRVSQLALESSVQEQSDTGDMDFSAQIAPAQLPGGDGPSADVAASTGSDDVNSALAGMDESAIATRESLIGEAPAWKVLEEGRIPDPDRESAGYPRPLATAREATLRELGEVAPPPEIGLLQPQRTRAVEVGSVTDTVAIASDIVRDAGAAALGTASDADRGASIGESGQPLTGIASVTGGVPDQQTDERAGERDASPTARTEGGESGYRAGSRGVEEATMEPPATGGGGLEAEAAATAPAIGSDRFAEATTEGQPHGTTKTADSRTGEPTLATDRSEAHDDKAVESDEMEDTAEMDDVGGIESLNLQRKVVGGEAGDSVAEDDELVASSRAPGDESGDATSGSQTGEYATRGRATPWVALLGLAASLAALGLLLLARIRRQRRYR